ncbi:MAG: hypothetical protein FWC20_03540 [Oscillospiraceae bacterium]|nr:hypothetical protein [Oscillospiraceae bacterium]MCL2278465.1 hypothetical protein [Oscillospiraceae bacterium]
MKRLSTILVILIVVVTLTVGCANILDGYFYLITPHVAPPYEREPVEQISVSDIDEFKEILINMVIEHETEAQILYHHFGNEDIGAEVEQVAEQIMRYHPIGAYAVANITVTATRIVTYFEVDVVIEFSRTIEELEEIITVVAERHLMRELLDAMGHHTEQVVFRSTLQLTEEAVAEKVRQLYYENPSLIVMLPFVTLESFPEEGNDRIYVIQFGFIYASAMMGRFSGMLSLYIEQNAERITGDTDPLRLLSLVRNLIASIEFEEGPARTISVHGAQNFSATAYGALVRGRAVGEGFAMAFKALSDEIGFDNRIVLGYLDGLIHAWNIVYLDGYFYHIDVAMSAVYGLEKAFLKSDYEFEAMGYEWDRENTVISDGPLSLGDILALEEPDYYEYEYPYDDTENAEGNEEVYNEQDNQAPDEPVEEPQNPTYETPYEEPENEPQEEG